MKNDATSKKNFAILIAAFKKFLEEGSGFYVELLQGLAHTHDIPHIPRLIACSPSWEGKQPVHQIFLGSHKQTLKDFPPIQLN
jgi:hypothetical protein